MRKTWEIFGVMTLSVASTSCLRQHKTPPRAFTPPPVHSRPAVPNTIPKLPQAPPVTGDETASVPPQLPEMTPENMPEVPEAPKRVARRPPPPVSVPKPTPVAPPIETPPPPRLAQLLTPEAQRENTKTLDETLDRVNQQLAKLDGKNLTVEQKEIAERIQTYRKQAEQAREQDLLTAVSLARRADLLAKDLLERLP